jgi:hypothetical protein
LTARIRSSTASSKESRRRLGLNAGIIDQDIQSAEGGDHTLDQQSAGRWIANISLLDPVRRRGGGCGMQCGHRLRRRPSVVDVIERDHRTLGGKTFRHRATDPARGTCHQSILPVQPAGHDTGTL